MARPRAFLRSSATPGAAQEALDCYPKRAPGTSFHACRRAGHLRLPLSDGARAQCLLFWGYRSYDCDCRDQCLDNAGTAAIMRGTAPAPE